MGDKDKLFNQVVSNLRACLISVQGGVPVAALNNDYKQLLGENIPYRKLGFGTLEDLIRSVPGFVLILKNGDQYVEAKSSETSKHISQLVQRQKKTASKARRKSGGYKNHTWEISSRVPPRFLFQKSLTVRQKGISNNAVSSNAGVAKVEPSTSKRLTSQIKAGNNYLRNKVPTSESQNINVHQKNEVPLLSRPTFPDPSSISSILRTMYNESRQDTSNFLQRQRPLQPVQIATPVNFLQLKQKIELDHRNLQPVQNLDPPFPPYNNFYISPLLDPLAGQNPAQKRLKTVSSTNFEKEKEEIFFTNEDLHFSTSYYEESEIQKQLEKGKLVTIQQKAGPCQPGGFVAKLVQLTQAHGWPEPNFVLLPRRPKQSQTLYTCRVCIVCPSRSKFLLINESNDYSTFPEEFVVSDQAKEKVAEIAYNDLSEKIAASNVPCAVTNDEKTVISRVTQLVDGQKQGIWAFKIEQDYRNLYNEVLPSNWIDIIIRSPDVIADKLADTSYIIRPKSARIVQNGVVTSKVSITQDVASPPDIVPPEVTYWDVFVTRAVSTIEIWLRFVGEEHSVLFESLSTDLEMHYLEKSQQYISPVVEVDKYYACRLEDGTSRVKVLSVSGNEATVKFIDDGEINKVPLKSLCVLDMRFSYLPSQAIKCKLYGLEKLSDSHVTKSHLIELVHGKVLVGEVINHQELSIILYDTSNEKPLNINSHIMDLVGIETYRPTLPEPSSLMEAVVSGCNSFGDVYLQVSTDGLTCILETLSSLSESACSPHKVTKKSQLKKDKVYLVAKSFENLSYRATVDSISSDPGSDEVDVFLIDYGRIMTVAVQQLYELEHISYFVGEIPPQIICVHLKDLPPSEFNEVKASKLEELAPRDEIVLVKVDSQSHTDSFPYVELFKRIKPNNILVSINNTIKINTEISLDSLKNIIDEEDAKIKMNFVEPDPVVVQPIVPEVEDGYFDIYVVEAANPSNFIVQPLIYITPFKVLMQELQEVYHSEMEIKVDGWSSRKGALCVALDKRGDWCRAVIDSVIGENVSVRYCDYAHCDILPISNVRPLLKKFQRFPAIGFSAKISGILPRHGDWTAQDCLRLQELVVGKKLVSIIKEKIPEPSLVTKCILGLLLIDTNTDIDLDIAHELVMERRAMYI